MLLWDQQGLVAGEYLFSLYRVYVLTNLSDETENLAPFSLEINFPTPPLPAAEAEVLPNDEDNFMLGVDQPDIGLASSSPNGQAGDLRGLSTNIPEHISEPGTPGVVGGGLRDEPLTRSRKQKKLSRHGIPVPNLPSGVVKRLAMRFARAGAAKKAKISKESLAAIEQASEWFFEQASEDLATYAKHAGRRTIDESDVMTLMRRCVLSYFSFLSFLWYSDF